MHASLPLTCKRLPNWDCQRGKSINEKFRLMINRVGELRLPLSRSYSTMQFIPSELRLRRYHHPEEKKLHRFNFLSTEHFPALRSFPSTHRSVACVRLSLCAAALAASSQSLTGHFPGGCLLATENRGNPLSSAGEKLHNAAFDRGASDLGRAPENYRLSQLSVAQPWIVCPNSERSRSEVNLGHFRAVAEKCSTLAACDKEKSEPR